MRVLFQVYIPASPRMAGIQQHIRVACYLARNNVDVTLYVCTSHFRSRGALLEFFGLSDCPRLEILFFPHPFARFRPKILLSAWGVVFHFTRLFILLFTGERRRYDIFFTRGRLPFSYMLVKRWLRLKIVLELHEIFYLNKVPEQRIRHFRKKIDLERFTYRNADGVVFISRQLRNLAEQKWGAANSGRVIPSGAIPVKCRPMLAAGALRRVYYVGNYYWFSGIEYLIQAMLQVPEATLTIVGGGGNGNPDKQRVSRLINDLGLENRVHVRGFIPPARLPGVYEDAEILVLPSIRSVRTRYFISPLKLFEYMSARRPIIASDLPTIREILRHEVNALLVRPEAPQELARAIHRLMDDPELAAGLAAQAYRDLKQFTMPTKTMMLKNFFQEVLQAKDTASIPPGRRDAGHYGPN